MHGKHLYEYAVIRLVPVLEREEFINVGILLFSKRQGFFGVRTGLNEARLNAFRSDLDLEQVRANLRVVEQIANGVPEAGPIALLPADERFRWLTAVRSTALQTSRPHAGLCTDLVAATEHLYRQLVL